MSTREYEYQSVRELLGEPKQQRPSSDLIVSGQIRTEQLFMNKLNGTARGWSPATATFASVAGTAEYSLYSNYPTNTIPLTGFGKALFIYRELSSTVIVPVDFTDYANELDNQSYAEVIAPTGPTTPPGTFGEKIAFFRNGQYPKLRIYPVPEEARVYKIVYATGALDWASFAWTDVPLLPEWSQLRCIANALNLLAVSEWDGNKRQENKDYRNELRAVLEPQYKVWMDEFESYIINPQHEPTIGVVDGWL